MTNDKSSLKQEVHQLLSDLGVPASAYTHGELVVRTPITGQVIARVAKTEATAVNDALTAARNAFVAWRSVPAPKRGDLVRLIGEELRLEMAALGRLVTIETMMQRTISRTKMPSSFFISPHSISRGSSRMNADERLFA